MGEDVIGQTLGSAMHVFLLNIPRLEFAAIIPKGDYVTMCLLGENIDSEVPSTITTMAVASGSKPLSGTESW